VEQVSKPIIFSGVSVQAILAGAKTQTRRLLKPQPSAGVRQSVFVPSGFEDGHGREIRVPYRPGMLLWVRESWRFGSAPNDTPEEVALYGEK